MSETAQAPRRGRPPRQQVEQQVRRRRQPGSLNRMADSVLAIPEECKDPDYHYHWVNDVRGRVRALTVHDDYDVVTIDELEETGRRNRGAVELNRDAFSGNGSTVSLPVDTSKSGHEIRAVLLKKRLSFYRADYEEGILARQDMMEGRVYEGATAAGDSLGAGARQAMDNKADPDDRVWDGNEAYVPESVNVSLPTRRKGPVTSRRL